MVKHVRDVPAIFANVLIAAVCPKKSWWEQPLALVVQADAVPKSRAAKVADAVTAMDPANVQAANAPMVAVQSAQQKMRSS